MTIFGVIISVFFVIVCILLVLIVLLQKGRGGGLGAALGGMGSAAFGTRVGDMMTWVTIVLTSLFLLLAIVGALLFRPEPVQAEKPRFIPDPEIPITEKVRVTIRAVGDDDTVFYTLDGSTPSRTSDKYKDHPFEVSPGMVVKAIAYPPRGLPSKVAVAPYHAPSPQAPRFSPEPNPQNPITGPSLVTIEKGAEGDKVYYTLDGTDPTENNRLYGAPVMVSPNVVLKARAYAPNAKPSEIVERTYGIKGPEPLTKPAVIPATAPATAPATRPATVPATRPATVPATAPATAPATRPATVPATAPATRPAGGE